MSTVIVVLAHHDYGDEYVTNVHGVYQSHEKWKAEAEQLHYSYDIPNDTYYTTFNDVDVTFEVTLQYVKGST